MVDATYIDNGRIQVVQDDDISFDTQRPSIKLLPESSRLVLNGLTVTFPSPIQATAYFRGVRSGGAVCEFWSTLIWQEWGPSEVYSNELYFPVTGVWQTPGPTTRNLPTTYLGSVSGSSNYLDIRARLRRTQAPPPFFGVAPVGPYVPENEWINLSSGGSCPVEQMYPLIRHFDIRRSGNDIYLDRYQSTHNTNSPLAPGGNPQRNISVNESGWNTGARSKNSEGLSSNVLNAYSNQNIILMMDARGPGPVGPSRRPGSNQDECAFPSFADLTSTYSVDLIITPGIYRPAA